MAAPLSSSIPLPLSAWPTGRLGNVLLLVTGFGLGQGAIFLAQTWLVAEGRLDLLADFGSLYAFAVLGVLIVETASTVTLARHVSAQGAKRAIAPELWTVFWATSVVRLGLAGIIVSIALAYALLAPAGFARNYTLALLPSYPLWALSAAGILDGLNRGGLSGITGIFPYICSAAALPLAAALDQQTAGLVLGAAFSLGTAGTLATQWLALHSMGHHPQRVRLSKPQLASAASEIFAVLFTMLPGQAHYRVQILLASLFLGPAATALFIYARQSINAVNTLFVFIQRVEFPHLVAQIATGQRRPVDALFSAFRLGLTISLVSALVLTLVGTCSSLLPAQFQAPANLVAVCAPLVLTLAISAALNQGLFAIRQAGYAARLNLIGACLGAGASLMLVASFGLWGLVAAEMGMHLFLSIAAYIPLRRAAETSGHE